MKNINHPRHYRETIRVVNSELHRLTAPQIIEQMEKSFDVSRSRPVLLLISPGSGKEWMDRLRTALSRTWTHRSKAKSIRHGLRSVDPFPWTDPISGDKYDCLPVYYHMSQAQRTRAAALLVSQHEGFNHVQD